MNQGTHPEELPAEVLDDAASVVGAEVTWRVATGQLSAVARLDFNETPSNRLSASR